MKKITEQLKGLKTNSVNPSSEWLKHSRSVLLSQINSSKVDGTIKQNTKSYSTERLWLSMSVFLPRNVVFNVVRPVMATLMIFALGTSGWIATVAASQDSLPGEWLYPAKKMTEKTEMVALVAVGAKETETKRRAGFAKRRAQEVQKLLVSKDPKKIQEVPEAINVLKEEMKKVDENLEEIKKEAPEKVSAAAVKNIGEQSEDIKAILKEVKIDLTKTSTTTESKEITKNLSEAQNIAGDTLGTAVEVLVDKHLQGDKTLSKEEVKEAISDQIKVAVADAGITTEVLEEVEKESDKAVADSKVTDVVSAGTILSDAITSSTAATVKAGLSQAKAASEEVGQKAGEAEEMLFQGNLEQALKFAQEAGDATKKVEAAVDKTIEVITKTDPDIVINAANNQAQASSTVPTVLPIEDTTSSTVQSTSTLNLEN